MSVPGIDISYAVSRDSDLINWLQFLESDNKTDLEWVAARDLSIRWQTTAVAYVSVYLPRYHNNSVATGTPRDGRLQYLSKKFAEHIAMKDAKQAIETYKLIQQQGLVVTMKFLKDE